MSGSSHKKGISPILAAVLMVAIAVTVVPIFAGWFNTLIGSTTKTVENKTDETVRCNAASLSIEDVYLDNANSRARMIVRNSGYTNEQVRSAVVYSNTGTPATNLTEFPVNVTRGGYAYFNFDTSSLIPACANFSFAIVGSACDSVRFDGVPKGC